MSDRPLRPGVTDCVYCGCAVEAHDPVFVVEGAGADLSAAAAYCNYACLSARIDEADLTAGATCELDARNATDA